MTEENEFEKFENMVKELIKVAETFPRSPGTQIIKAFLDMFLKGLE